MLIAHEKEIIEEICMGGKGAEGRCKPLPPLGLAGRVKPGTPCPSAMPSLFEARTPKDGELPSFLLPPRSPCSIGRVKGGRQNPFVLPLDLCPPPFLRALPRQITATYRVSTSGRRRSPGGFSFTWRPSLYSTFRCNFQQLFSVLAKHASRGHTHQKDKKKKNPRA